MTMAWIGSPKSFDVPCTVEIEQTSETLHAHVVLDGDIQIQPGDEVRVHNAPTMSHSANAWWCGEPRRWFAPVRSIGCVRGWKVTRIDRAL